MTIQLQLLAAYGLTFVRALLMSGFLLRLIFMYCFFFNSNSNIIAGNITKKDYIGIFLYSLCGVFNWKGNKEVGIICFELGIPKKKTPSKIGNFLCMFKMNIHIWIQQFYFGRNQNYFWERFYSIKTPLGNRAINNAGIYLSKVLCRYFYLNSNLERTLL